MIVLESNVSETVLEWRFDLVGGSAYQRRVDEGGRLRSELILENAVPLSVVEKLRAHLAAAGYSVYVTMTPDDDTDGFVRPGRRPARRVCDACGSPLNADQVVDVVTAPEAVVSTLTGGR